MSGTDLQYRGHDSGELQISSCGLQSVKLMFCGVRCLLNLVGIFLISGEHILSSKPKELV